MSNTKMYVRVVIFRFFLRMSMHCTSFAPDSRKGQGFLLRPSASENKRALLQGHGLLLLLGVHGLCPRSQVLGAGGLGKRGVVGPSWSDHGLNFDSMYSKSPAWPCSFQRKAAAAAALAAAAAPPRLDLLHHIANFRPRVNAPLTQTDSRFKVKLN